MLKLNGYIQKKVEEKVEEAQEVKEEVEEDNSEEEELKVKKLKKILINLLYHQREKHLLNGLMMFFIKKY